MWKYVQNRTETNTEREGRWGASGINTQNKVLNVFAVVKHEKMNMFWALFLAWSRVIVVIHAP